MVDTLRVSAHRITDMLEVSRIIGGTLRLVLSAARTPLNGSHGQTPALVLDD
jgi:hypothetical protein